MPKQNPVTFILPLLFCHFFAIKIAFEYCIILCVLYTKMFLLSSVTMSLIYVYLLFMNTGLTVISKTHYYSLSK